MVTDQDIRTKVYDHYQKGQGSLQDIARVYRISVPEVLEIIGAPELGEVTTVGDMIDPSEIGPGAQFNYSKNFTVPFTTD